jgi:hypothetical protein
MIDSIDALRRLYAAPGERAVRKQLAALDAHCRHFVSRSPFVVIASVGANGLPDASPRGGAPGFVRVADDGSLLVPDAPGNNRLDTLENIVATGRAGLLFFVPGVDETLRVNGLARLDDDPAMLESMRDARRAPKLAIRVSVCEAYLHCAKSLMRSRLWDPASRIDRSSFPTMGRMLADQVGGVDEGQDAMLARYAGDL